MIRDTLLNLGLNNKEIDIYLATVKLGTSSAATIAKEVRLPRQTVYSIIQDLVEQEYIDQSDTRGVKQFFVDPHKLFFLIDRWKRRLDRNRRILEQDINELLAMQGKRKGAFPRMQYYDGIDGLKRLFNAMLEQFKGKKSRSFRGYGVNTYPAELDSFLRQFIRQRAGLGVNTSLFIAEGPDNFDSEKFGREVKRLNIPSQEASLYLVGDCIYLFSYRDNVGTMIENTAMAELLKRVFDDHWEKSPDSHSP